MIAVMALEIIRVDAMPAYRTSGLLADTKSGSSRTAVRLRKNSADDADPPQSLVPFAAISACGNARDNRYQARIEHGYRTGATARPRDDCIDRDSCDRALRPSRELLQLPVTD